MDVEVYKNFDVLLLWEAFFGKIIYEDILLIKTQIFWWVKNLDIFKQLLLIYNELNDLKEWALDFVFSDFFIWKYNIKNPYKSEVIDWVCFYDIDYFSWPLFLYCRHLALDSWVSYNSDYVKNKIILKYKVIHILNISSFRNILKMYFKKSEKLNYKKLL
jgi:hypothetical protein